MLSVSLFVEVPQIFEAFSKHGVDLAHTRILEELWRAGRHPMPRDSAGAPKVGSKLGAALLLHFDLLLECSQCIKAINGHFSAMNSQQFLEPQLFEHVTFVEELYSNTCSLNLCAVGISFFFPTGIPITQANGLSTSHQMVTGRFWWLRWQGLRLQWLKQKPPKYLGNVEWLNYLRFTFVTWVLFYMLRSAWPKSKLFYLC